jgi:hypothetical protein
LNGSFHEALPVCDVFAGKKHVSEPLLERVSHSEPLAGTIESVRASSKWIRLPGLLLHCKSDVLALVRAPVQAVRVGDIFNSAMAWWPRYVS